MSPILQLKNISKTFQDVPGQKLAALHDITCDIAQGEFFVILGPSGSGKSTLLRIASGLEKEYRGEVQYSQTLTKKDFSFVFQQFALLPWLTVYQNAEMGLVGRGLSLPARREKVLKQLKIFGLEKFAHSFPRELSGGMKQRVGLARAMANDPKIIFMDEPFSEVDSFTAAELRKELLGVWEEQKVTIVMVTHLIEEALELADRVAVLTDRPGKLEAVLENTLPRPRNKRSPEFFELQDGIYGIIKP